MIRFGRTAAATATGLLILAGTAHAGPADLDPTFGSGGVAIAAGTDRLDPQGGPMLTADGRIAGAGLLRNASDRVFLARFLTTGAPDSSFDGDGQVHTNVIGQPDRRASVAQSPDGKYVVAGGASNKATITLERYLASGAPDTAFGMNGKLAHTITGNYFKAVAAIATSDGRTYVSGWTNHGGNTRAFVVLRFTSTAVDPTWGTAGVARVPFTGKNATAWDIALLSNGKLLAAGSAGDNAASNTAIARLNANGTLDTTFGSGGRVETDASRTSTFDQAEAIVADATGGFALAGRTASSGYVARYASTGVLESGFGSNGIVNSGFAPAGLTSVLSDITTDLAGRLVVVGRSQQGTGATATHRWIVARLNRTGAAPLDPGFGTGGVTALSVCSNNGGFGPTGVNVDADGRILVLGACGPQGRVAAVRLLGIGAFIGDAGLSVDDAGSASGHERIPLENVEPAQVLRAFEDLQAAELRESPARPNPARPNPARPNPARPNPIRVYTTLRSLPVRPNPARPNPVTEHILLSQIPLLGRTWSELLGVEAPEQSLTLADAFRIAPDAVGALTLNDVDPDGTIMRRLSLASLVLGLRPLSVLPPPEGGWCAYLQGKGIGTCAPDTTTLFDLEVAGVDLSDYLSEPLKIARPSILGTGEDRAPLAYIPINEMELSRTPYGPVLASTVADIVNCGTNCSRTLTQLQQDDPEGFSSATFDRLADHAGVPDATLGQVLAGLLAPQDIPYERAPLRNLLDAAAIRDGDLQTYTTTFRVDCAQSSGLQAIADLADDARPKPGSATVQRTGSSAAAVAAPTRDQNGSYVFDLAAACTGAAVGTIADTTFRFSAEPGSTLGRRTTSILLRSSFGEVSPPAVDVAIDDSHDPGEELENSRTLEADALRASHLEDAGDVDSWSFTPDRPGLITITLDHLPVDIDLLVFGPGAGVESSPARPNPARPNALVFNPVPDLSETQADPTQVAPDGVQDIPARPNPARPNPARPNELRGHSIKRGTAAESVTVVVRPGDVGQIFTAQAVGYNGANDDDPYIIRRYDRPAPPAPPCITRSLSAGVPGAFPTSVPSSTRTLYLVNEQRLAARDTQAKATQVRGRLDALAAVTDGVVVPVESDRDRDTGAAYSAWDASPCDVAKANDVVEAINGVVDHVRSLGGGLPQLRHIVLVGSDDILPQARVPDDTVMANESTYAEETVLRDLENPVSAAQRSAYVLSDDPFGDFDQNATLPVPDVGLGRLVEHSDDIIAQADGYLNGDRFVVPRDVFSAGYDFLKDGAQAQLDALSTITAASRSRIDETWTAADLQAEMNRADAGFTAISAHYSHWEALPADAFNNLSPNLLNARDVSPAAKSMAFSVGCHSGLSLVVPVSNATQDEADRLGGWVDRHASRGALYVGNTGYGYGDTDVVGMSEKLMADWALFVATKQVTVGQALAFAKQANAGTLTDAYWNKSSTEATFYGLPFYTVGSDGTESGAALPPQIQPPQQVNLVSTSRSLSASPIERTSSRGRYWQVGDEEPLVIQNRPIQPKTVVDVTADDGLRLHGYLPEDLTSVEIAGVDPVIARPTIDLAAHEPEPDVQVPLFPSSNFTVESVQAPDGRRDQLTFIAGEFRGGTQRLFTHVEGRLLRSNSDDFEPPVIELVDGALIGDGFTFSVQTDATDVVGGNVLFRTDGGTEWHRTPLATVGSGRLAGGGTLPSGTKITEAKIHVYDRAGNVAGSDNKVIGYALDRIVADPSGPTITFDPAGLEYYATPPRISIDPGQAAGETFEYSIDGGQWTLFAGSFTPEVGEGEHFVRVRSSGGKEALARFAIDSQGPVVTVAGLSPVPNDAGWNNGDVEVSFECADAVSGVRTCPAPVTVTGEGENLSAPPVTATDRAGRTTTFVATGINIDRTKPQISGARDHQPNADGWHKAPVTVTWTCTDGLSGIGFCSDSKTLGQGRDQSATGRAVDVAGNEQTATVGPIHVDLGDPSVDITSSGILVGRLQGTAADALSGVRTVRVWYRRSGSTQLQPADDVQLNCNAARTSCNWSAAPPGLGFWTAFAEAEDIAGRIGAPRDQAEISVF